MDYKTKCWVIKQNTGLQKNAKCKNKRHLKQKDTERWKFTR